MKARIRIDSTKPGPASPGLGPGLPARGGPSKASGGNGMGRSPEVRVSSDRGLSISLRRADVQSKHLCRQPRPSTAGSATVSQRFRVSRLGRLRWSHAEPEVEALDHLAGSRVRGLPPAGAAASFPHVDPVVRSPGSMRVCGVEQLGQYREAAGRVVVVHLRQSCVSARHSIPTGTNASLDC
jgi:hypothetical protein